MRIVVLGACALALSGCVATGVICEPANADTEDTEDTAPAEEVGGRVQIVQQGKDCQSTVAIAVPPDVLLWTAEACDDEACTLALASRDISSGVVTVPCEAGQRVMITYADQIGG